jgi:hypothetical protein
MHLLQPASAYNVAPLRAKACKQRGDASGRFKYVSRPSGGAAVSTGTFGRRGIVRHVPRCAPGRGPLGPEGTAGETCRPAHVDVPVAFNYNYNAFNFQRAGNSRKLMAAGIDVILPPGLSCGMVSVLCIH